MTREIDLHGLTVDEAIRRFAAEYNALFERGYRDRIEIIHGYGSSGTGGVIRRRLRSFLSANADRFSQITEGDALGNPGVTYVYPKGRLPVATPQSAVAAAIVAFCSTPKSESKIVTKLVGRYGDPAIRAAIRELVRGGALRAVDGGAETKFVSSLTAPAS